MNIQQLRSQTPELMLMDCTRSPLIAMFITCIWMPNQEMKPSNPMFKVKIINRHTLALTFVHRITTSTTNQPTNRRNCQTFSIVLNLDCRNGSNENIAIRNTKYDAIFVGINNNYFWAIYCEGPPSFIVGEGEPKRWHYYSSLQFTYTFKTLKQTAKVRTLCVYNDYYNHIKLYKIVSIIVQY